MSYPHVPQTGHLQCRWDLRHVCKRERRTPCRKTAQLQHPDFSVNSTRHTLAAATDTVRVTGWMQTQAPHAPYAWCTVLSGAGQHGLHAAPAHIKVVHPLVSRCLHSPAQQCTANTPGDVHALMPHAYSLCPGYMLTPRPSASPAPGLKQGRSTYTPVHYPQAQRTHMHNRAALLTPLGRPCPPCTRHTPHAQLGQTHSCEP